MEKVLDFGEYFYVVKKHLWLILLITAITTGIGVYSARQIVPSYQGTMKIFLSTTGSTEDLMNFYTESELQAYGDFVKIFTEIMGLPGFMEESLQKYDLNINPSAVRGGLNITSSDKTPIFTLNYSSYNQEIIPPVLKAVSDSLSIQVSKLIQGKKVQVLSEPTTYMIMPSKYKRVIFGFGFGAMLSLIILFIKYYMDNTIKTREQLEKLLPIPVLGEIPSHERKFAKEEKKYVSSEKNATIYISGSLQNLKNKA